MPQAIKVVHLCQCFQARSWFSGPSVVASWALDNGEERLPSRTPSRVQSRSLYATDYAAVALREHSLLLISVRSSCEGSTCRDSTAVLCYCWFDQRATRQRMKHAVVFSVRI